ncbi:NAD(P)-dependent oxidoreductase [Actinocorallia populi]|uniref:NAD(P)-dependent oxidoreductase n=1 Tax=Actinocorallia populi TaxID=2079200 RepID=UPI000D08EE1B|nr:NAD(P)-dependent oxidoreductase [Actinocorallia populi]
MSAVTKVGFIGLGSQGAPMARRIIEAGIPTTLWARRAETLESFAGTGARFAASPAEVGAASDLACVCVVDDAGVEEVVSGPNGLLEGMRLGSVIAVHSTVHPDTCARLAERAAERGVGLVDAPVSGGGPAAEAGTLLVMAGGSPEDVERCAPVFRTYGDPVVHLGPLGAGQRAKLINNLLLAANLGVAEGAFALARAFGVDPEQLSVVLERGSGSSFATGMMGRSARFTLEPMGAKAGPLLQKDARIAGELADSLGVKVSSVFEAADAALESMGCAR